jgi:4a-hydroxytetrahydrobiopterin dehydratase
MKLHKKKCVPCEDGTLAMNKLNISKNMKRLNDWQLIDSKKIFKDYKFKDDKTAINFLAKIAKTSTIEGHHPAVEWIYNKVSVTFWTHSVNGLTENDFIMAEKFDRIYGK